MRVSLTTLAAPEAEIRRLKAELGRAQDDIEQLQLVGRDQEIRSFPRVSRIGQCNFVRQDEPGEVKLYAVLVIYETSVVLGGVRRLHRHSRRR